jgi:homoserine dehydrogenase
MVGEVMFYGPGAGKLPTASAVVADIIDIIAARDNDVRPIVWEQADASDIADFGDYECRRMFIAKSGASCDLACTTVKNGDLVAFITDDCISENVSAELAEAFGDALVSTYRVL